LIERAVHKANSLFTNKKGGKYYTRIKGLKEGGGIWEGQGFI